MFSKQQLEKLKAMGSAGLTIKLAQHDGYEVSEEDSQEKQLTTIFGQKYFEKKASMKKIVMGISALEKVSNLEKNAFWGFGSSDKKKKKEKKEESRKEERDRLNNEDIRRYAKQEGYTEIHINSTGTRGTFYNPSTGGVIAVNHKATGTDSKGRKL